MFEENEDIEIDEIEPNELDDGVTDPPEPNEEPGKEEPPKPEFDKEEYGKKVQKRIDKLTYEVKSRDTELEQLRKRLDDFERQRQEADRDNEQNQLTSKIVELRRQKVNALEMGEYETAADIDDQIIELKVSQRKEPKQEPRQSVQQQPAEEQQQVMIPEAQQEWLDSNDWFFNPRKAQQKEKANAIYLKLVDEGYDPEHPDTYVELDKRMNTKRQQAPSPAGVDRGAAATGNGKVVFTAADKQKMMAWGLDPNNPEQRKEYLKNKVA